VAERTFARLPSRSPRSLRRLRKALLEKAGGKLDHRMHQSIQWSARTSGTTSRHQRARSCVPTTYQFCGSLESKARQIGNAVPPKFAEAIGSAIKAHAQTG
jgi:site-specific DNA-cytosine methylase